MLVILIHITNFKSHLTVFIYIFRTLVTEFYCFESVTILSHIYSEMIYINIYIYIYECVYVPHTVDSAHQP